MGNAANQVVVRNESTNELEVLDLTTGEVVSTSAPKNQVFVFDYPTALLICQMVKEGKTFAEIEAIPGMPPYSVISHWQRTDRMFAEELKIARKERGEVYHDRAMAIAQNAAAGLHKDAVPSAALAAKLYQWGAEKAKPDAYGTKTIVEGNPEKPILMRVINTGISRSKPDVPVAITKEVTNGETTETNRSTSPGAGGLSARSKSGTRPDAHEDEED